MQAVRRIYLYLIAFISLETAVWSAIRLARALLAGSRLSGDASSLAGPLSLVLIGLPVFGLHWWWVQREAARHPDARGEWVRALFLHGTLLFNLIAAIQNFLALVNRLLFSLFNLDPAQALLGGGQSWGDNLVSIILNLAAALLVFLILRSDLRVGATSDATQEIRRLHIALWSIYGLGLTILGVQKLLQYLLSAWNMVGSGARAPLANGLALVLVGLPVWYFAGLRVRRLLVTDPDWQAALPRLRILYAIALISAAGVLPTLGMVLFTALRRLLGVDQSMGELLAHLSMPLSSALPLGAVWLYYSYALRAEIHQPAEIPAPSVVRSMAPVNGVYATGWFARFRATARRARAIPLPGRAGLRRLYYYTLALLGLGALFLGLYLLLAYLVDLAFSGQVVWGDVLRSNLAAALAALLVGIPFWLFAWLPVQLEAVQDNEQGEYARRSVIRRGYLFLVSLVSLIGLLVSAGSLLFLLLTMLLGDPPLFAEVELGQRLKTALLFAVFLGYHWQVLQRDNHLAEKVLTRRRSLYPVLILSPDEGDFGVQVAEVLESEAAGLPIAVHYYEQGAPDETLSAARAVILPAELVTKPSEALRLWLQNFEGPRLVIPTQTNGWQWVSAGGRSVAALARQAAHIVRHLAEGEVHTHSPEASAWMLVVYILAGLFTLEILAGLAYLIATATGVI